MSGPTVVFLLAVPPVSREIQEAEARGVDFEIAERTYAKAMRVQYQRMLQKAADGAVRVLGCEVPAPGLAFHIGATDRWPNSVTVVTPWAATLIACPGREFKLRVIPVGDDILLEDLAAFDAPLGVGRRTRR